MDDLSHRLSPRSRVLKTGDQPITGQFHADWPVLG